MYEIHISYHINRYQVLPQDWRFAYYLAAGLNLKALHQRWLRSLRQPSEREESRTAPWHQGATWHGV